MIGKEEILGFAREVGLDANVVEKDYVLGWMLAGISSHQRTQDTWLFKGGTCLKKCYFETYRFSEDLDFTLLDSSHIDESVLRLLFSEITQWVYDQSGIEMPETERGFEVYTTRNSPRHHGISRQGGTWCYPGIPCHRGTVPCRIVIPCHRSTTCQGVFHRLRMLA